MTYERSLNHFGHSHDALYSGAFGVPESRRSKQELERELMSRSPMREISALWETGACVDWSDGMIDQSIGLLNRKNEMVRSEAALALRAADRVQGDLLRTLIGYMKSEASEQVQAHLALAVGQLALGASEVEQAATIEALLMLLDGSSGRYVRDSALHALSDVHFESGQTALAMASALVDAIKLGDEVRFHVLCGCVNRLYPSGAEFVALHMRNTDTEHSRHVIEVTRAQQEIDECTRWYDRARGSRFNIRDWR